MNNFDRLLKGLLKKHKGYKTGEIPQIFINTGKPCIHSIRAKMIADGIYYKEL